jgi:hypothetical protein
VLVERGAEGLRVDVEQAFGNCPKYIRPRQLAADAPQGRARRGHPRRHAVGGAAGVASPGRRRSSSAPRIPTAASTRPTAAARPGFIRVEDGALWWPDYPGNNMFTSFGNLAVDDTAAVLVPDFGTGTSLLLSGRAAVEWVTAGSAATTAAPAAASASPCSRWRAARCPSARSRRPPRGAAA